MQGTPRQGGPGERPAHPPDICPEAGTGDSLSSFHARLGTPEPLRAGDCDYREAESASGGLIGPQGEAGSEAGLASWG